MKTTMPQSTISYNSREYLILRLNELYNSHIIQFWCFIHHLPEPSDSTGGLKDHFHVYFEPSSRRFDTDDFRDFMKEPDIMHPNKPPLGCARCQKSKFSDWFLYGMHNESYLASKLLSRVYHYPESDFVYSDFETYRYLVSEIDYSPYKSYDRFKELVVTGITWESLLNAGFVPMNQLFAYREVYRALSPNPYEQRPADPRFAAQNNQKDPSMVDDEGKPLFDKEIKY